jgi:hypothetical protein
LFSSISYKKERSLYFFPIGQKDLPLCVLSHYCFSIDFAIDQKTHLQIFFSNYSCNKALQLSKTWKHTSMVYLVFKYFIQEKNKHIENFMSMFMNSYINFDS